MPVAASRRSNDSDQEPSEATDADCTGENHGGLAAPMGGASAEKMLPTTMPKVVVEPTGAVTRLTTPPPAGDCAGSMSGSRRAAPDVKRRISTAGEKAAATSLNTFLPLWGPFFFVSFSFLAAIDEALGDVGSGQGERGAAAGSRGGPMTTLRNEAAARYTSRPRSPRGWAGDAPRPSGRSPSSVRA